MLEDVGEGVADLGKAGEGSGESAELLAEEVEELGGVHLVEFAMEMFEALHDAVLLGEFAVIAGVVIAIGLAAESG